MDYAFGFCPNLTHVYCYAVNVPSAYVDAFYGSHCQNATLHVPEESLDAYRNTISWRAFGTIVALTDDDPNPTEIKGVNSEAITTECYYSLDGKRFTTPQHGLNIVKMSDGSTRKVMIE